MIERTGDDNGFCSPNLDTVAMSSYLLLLRSLSNTGDLKETKARAFFIEPEPRQRKSSREQGGFEG